jgi:hypothetical protein
MGICICIVHHLWALPVLVVGEVAQPPMSSALFGLREPYERMRQCLLDMQHAIQHISLCMMLSLSERSVRFSMGGIAPHNYGSMLAAAGEELLSLAVWHMSWALAVCARRL